jgi:S-formylglutathione hydrolase
MRCFVLLLAAAFAAMGEGVVEKITVHGRSLEGNLIGDSPDRQVTVYLPKAYATEKKRRFPVIYFLHGYTDSDDKWFRTPAHWIQFAKVLDAAGGDFIVVMPNAYNAFQGSMYSSSVTVGDWETFVAKELPAAIDARYRTLARPAARGIAGHSMGGYGALRVGVRHPDVFAAVYALSPCCMESVPGASAKAETVKSMEEFAAQDFMTKATLARAAAWSPNAKRPPLYLDLPVLARWSANATLAFVHQETGNLKRLKGIAFDAGDQDKSIAATCRELHGVLENYGIAHEYAQYEGNHVNRIAERVERQAIPFFTRMLEKR